MSAPPHCQASFQVPQPAYLQLCVLKMPRDALQHLPKECPFLATLRMLSVAFVSLLIRGRRITRIT